MHDRAERTQHIRQRLEQLLLHSLDVPMSVVRAEDWVTLPRTPGEQFGFLWPRPFDDTVIVVFSPDLIAKQTDWLEDDELANYLDMVELMLARSARDTLVAPDRDPDERRYEIEAELWALRHDALPWLSQVQLRILDRVVEAQA